MGKNNYLKNAISSTDQNHTVSDGIPNNAALSVPPSVPDPELKPLDKIKELPAKKRSRELVR